MAALLALQLEHRHAALAHLAQGFTPEEAQRPLYDGGPCASWIFDHLSEMSATTLAALGGPLLEASVGEGWPQAHQGFAHIAAQLLRVARELAPDAWQSAPAIEVLPDFRESLRTRQDFLMGHIFHLAWHAGQLGSLRNKLRVSNH
ncbi:MAG: hypothetical protein R3F33_15080 [Planctomycetota bacterium]